MKRWIGKAYRADSGYRHDKETTVKDVVNYEQDELGNDINLDSELFEEVKNSPAKLCFWVTMTRVDAKRYGKPEEFCPDGYWILGEDGDGGYLLVLKD